IFKVGSQLFTVCGPEAINMVKKKGAQVFLDLKFHDIPNTVREAVIAGTVSAVMMTVHIKGGREMLEAAVKGATDKAKELNIDRPSIIGVTRLTSGKNESTTEQDVMDAARCARDAGLDGVVCSVHEAGRIRKEFGKDFLIVTPGIRPKGYPSDDQSRIATAKQAVEAGADFIVVGRPIIKAEDPKKVAEDIAEEISQVKTRLSE
ncbi:MAG: orotidine-5'-phosphate decarboxylase, partial [Candidatus Omnitrophica bacterium]|nr:orotidine-5'-phosphate decarboxylase [Candidatus Omnitrophota bacterium]